jgi:hypothetical protein
MHKERNKKDVLTEKDFYRVSRVASRVVAMVSCAVRCGSFDILDRKRNLVEYPSFPRDSRTVRRTYGVRGGLAASFVPVPLVYYDV